MPPKLKKMNKSILKNMLYGTALGDAIGIPYEGTKRNTFECKKMEKCFDDSFYKVSVGTWSDKTSIMLSMMDAISNSEKDIKKISELYFKNLAAWKLSGTFSLTNPPFCIEDYMIKPFNSLLDEQKISGNINSGLCLMNVLPLGFLEWSIDDCLSIIIDSDKFLFNDPVAIVSSLFLAVYLRELIRGNSCRSALYNTVFKLEGIYHIPELDVLFTKDILTMTIDNLKDDYSAATILINSIWCLMNTSSYKAAVFSAVNLGDTCSLYGALTGAMAAVLYNSTDTTMIMQLKGKKIIDKEMNLFFIPDPVYKEDKKKTSILELIKEKKEQYLPEKKKDEEKIKRSKYNV